MQICTTASLTGRHRDDLAAQNWTGGTGVNRHCGTEQDKKYIDGGGR